ncbi:MAG TPA: hypothetical protein VI755_11625 [Anaerolineales bacterium]|nr:hypothetical protein [Anaerolineales bacterium]
MANQLLYGFIQLKDLAARRVTEVGVQVVNDAINQSVAEHNRQIDAILELFAQRTTDFKEKFNSPTVARLQPLDEQGRARPIKMAGQYGVAYPLQDGGTAWGATFKAREKMSVQEANDITATLTSADVRWLRDHILAALFANVAWTFNDPLHDALTIEGLANGDAVKYLVHAGADTGATDTHYLAQAAAIADASNPFPTIYTELTEHPENEGEVIAFIPSNVKSAVEGLATFYPERDPNVQEGSGVSVLSGTLGIPLPSGPRSLLGYTDKVWIAEWKSLPDNYLVSMTTGGARPLKMREEPEETLRGFKKVGERNDHPFYESQWLRSAGFGAFNRVGAVIYRVSNASYAIPTGYTSPMA